MLGLPLCLNALYTGTRLLNHPRRVDRLRETLRTQEADLARQNAAARALVEDKQRQMEAVARQGDDLAAQQAGLQVREVAR